MLLKKIDQLRLELNQEIEKNNNDLAAKSVQEKSQELDRMIVKIYMSSMSPKD